MISFAVFPLDYVELCLKERPRSHPSLMLEQMGSFSFDEPTNEIQTTNVPKATSQFEIDRPESSGEEEQETTQLKYRPLSPDIARNYDFQNATISKSTNLQVD